MTKQTEAQAQILERMLYMLEENSVMHVAYEDESFAKYIASLYEDISTKSLIIRTAF